MPYKKNTKYKTYVFILENNQACNVSDNGPQEKLFAFVDLKHTLWCKIALIGDFSIVVVIDVFVSVSTIPEYLEATSEEQSLWSP